jgi:hypothetical protein
MIFAAIRTFLNAVDMQWTYQGTKRNDNHGKIASVKLEKQGRYPFSGLTTDQNSEAKWLGLVMG